MAMGYAKCTRQPSVCCVTVGPGATNATSGVAEAYVESLPVIFMAMRHSARIGLVGRRWGFYDGPVRAGHSGSPEHWSYSYH